MKLKYVVALSMTYAPSQSSRKNTMDFMFIMKKNTNSVKFSSDKAICIFDRNKFYGLDEIYSEGKFSKHYRQVKIKSFERNLDWGSLSKDWSSRFMLVNYEQIFKIYGITSWFGD
jgi:hypothetical protein